MANAEKLTAANSRARLIEMAHHNMGVIDAGELERVDEVLRVPASHYYDEERWQLEMDRVFKRLPMMLAARRSR